MHSGTCDEELQVGKGQAGRHRVDADGAHQGILLWRVSARDGVAGSDSDGTVHG